MPSLVWAAALSLSFTAMQAFQLPSTSPQQKYALAGRSIERVRATGSIQIQRYSTAAASVANDLESVAWDRVTEDWELDCYSRPVLVGGKKLWEILITDSSGNLRVCRSLPSNK